MIGFNDIGTTHPHLISEWDFNKNSIDPKQVSFGMELKVWWVGSCGHSWKSSVLSKAKGGGCPTCSKGGFRTPEPATLYFIHNSKLQAFKVGITNLDNKVDRLSRFAKQGWGVIERWESDSGFTILRCETLFFQWLRKDKQIPVFLDNSVVGPTGGASETFSDSILTQAEVIAKIEELFGEHDN